MARNGAGDNRRSRPGRTAVAEADRQAASAAAGFPVAAWSTVSLREYNGDCQSKSLPAFYAQVSRQPLQTLSAVAWLVGRTRGTGGLPRETPNGRSINPALVLLERATGIEPA